MKPASSRVCELGRARDLHREIDAAYGWIHELVLEFDGGVVGRDCASVDAVASGFAHGLAGSLGYARSLACGTGSARGLARELGRIRDLAHNLGSELDLSRDLALHEKIRARAIAMDRADVLDRRLDALRIRSQRLVSKLEPAAAGGVRVSGGARWLVRLAVRMMPTGKQARYAEEWRGELWDLAATSGLRRQQTAHALRLLIRAWPVRRGIHGQRRTASGS